jgi:iron complex outermembrane recepter protein
MTHTAAGLRNALGHWGSSMKTSARLHPITVASAVALALALNAAHAAEQAAASDEATEEIVITGSSIRGVAPVGSSLIAVSRDDIENSTAVTTTKLLQETPQILNYGVTDSSRSGNGGAGNITYGSAANLRGVSPFATLTLINGRRVIPNGTTGASIDPQGMPTVGLERIEVVADGASAIYGSDAVAGVVNLIMRRNVDGFEVSGQQGMGDSYRDAQINAVAGQTWEGGQVTAAFMHSYRSALNGQDRDFYSADLTSQGGKDYRVTQCNPGTIVIGSGAAAVNYAIPATGATAAGLVAGTRNLCDPVKVTDILPQQDVDSGTLTLDQNIGDSVRFYFDAVAASRDGSRRSAAATQNLVVPSTNAFFVRPTGLTNTSETVQYSFERDWGGAAMSQFYSHSVQATAGFEVKLWGDWQADVYYTRGRNHDHVTSVGNAVDTPNLTAALASSDPTKAFNPFGTGVNRPDVLAGIFNSVTDTDGVSRLQAAELKLDGPLFSLPAGEARMAVGIEYYAHALRTGQVRGRIGAQTGTDQFLARQVTSGYAELNLPIIGAANAVTGIRRLDLNIAGRVDEYSDVGSTSNPKIGVNWAPFDQLTVHASYGQSFRAPGLTQLTSAGGSQLYIQNYFDPTANGGAGATVQGVALSGGNLNLTPETARTYSYGFDYTPDWLPGAQLALNYFDLVYREQVAGYLSNLNVLRQESLFASIITRNPGAPFMQALLDQGLRLNGGSVATALATPVFVDGRPNNLGITIARGVDFSLSAPLNTASMGDFRFGVRGVHYLTFKSAISPTATPIERVNNIDYPVKFRARASALWNLGNLSANLFVNHQGKYWNTLTTPIGGIDAYTTVDAGFAYSFDAEEGDFRNGLKLGLDVNNLLDADVPFVDIAPTNNGGGGYDAQAANPIGRVVTLSLSKKF